MLKRYRKTIPKSSSVVQKTQLFVADKGTEKVHGELKEDYLFLAIT